ncbi:MAG: phosphoenolpyruvate carboxykinase (ATP) [Bacilli bacterium]|nr:phosphoenolpyruvate carboxykinase (ATP) [Bacilli bacterium]
MATLSNLPAQAIGLKSPKVFSRVRSTIETAFYRNNVIEITTLAQAYELAKAAKGTIITDQIVANAKELGLPEDARVLLFNDGNITGRQARLRKLVSKENEEKFASLVREVDFLTNKKTMYHAQVIVGLDPEFMVKAHLLVPEGYENTLYNWVNNFQIVNPETLAVYKQSKVLDEADIFIFADPDCYPAEFPEGLALFDEKNNCACLLGMRYFGEFKKGTLTLAWSIAARNGYTACHGGQKRFNLEGGKERVIGVFGLSGSGKSTITLSNHNGKFDTTVLHDDAFIISNTDASSISLEPAYFDKTQDYLLDNPQRKYFVSIQNCAATRDEDGKLVAVTEDIRNGNGRTVKSRFATPKREYRFAKNCDAIFWIMKDSSLPPVVKVNSPALASAMGATLATKRTTAEYVKGEDTNKLVIVPYANPFRLYPLEQDYLKFKDLFTNMGVDCYIINTGFFLEKKVTPKVTLGLIEDIVTDKAKFVKFGPFTELEFLNIEGFEPDFKDSEYVKMVAERMQDRLNYVQELDTFNRLPEEALAAIRKVTEEAK